MIYTFGTKSDLEQLPISIDVEVKEEISKIVIILDENYGNTRNIKTDDGGYILLVEGGDDIKNVDIPSSPLELAYYIGKSGFIALLYVTSSDFGVTIITEVNTLRKTYPSLYSTAIERLVD